jgi:hypothetical protein
MIVMTQEEVFQQAAKEQLFHESSPHEPRPPDDIDILIAGDMGHGLVMRLERKGTRGLVTKESDPGKLFQPALMVHSNASNRINIETDIINEGGYLSCKENHRVAWSCAALPCNFKCPGKAGRRRRLHVNNHPRNT